MMNIIQILDIHDSNRREINMAMIAAGGIANFVDELPGITLRDFMRLLAQNEIELTAKYQGEREIPEE